MNAGDPIPTGAPSHARMPSVRARWIFAAGVCSLLVALPSLLFEFPLATDLPQHLAQIELLRSLEAGAPESAQYDIVRFAPNTLIYSLLEVVWSVTGPRWCGRVSLALLSVAWVLATFALGVRRKRTISVAVLASIFVFNLSLYWGFLNFMVAYPVFVGWWLLATQPMEWRRWLGIVALSTLLLWAHSLWFGFACLLFPLLVLPARAEIWNRKVWIRAIAALCSMLPAGIASLVWAPRLAAAREGFGFDIAAHWSVPFTSRLNILYLTDHGLEGSDFLPRVIVVAVLLWIAAATWRAVRDADSITDLPLLKTAGLACGIYLFAPDQYLNSIFLSARWLPCALAWIVLALPPPGLRDRVLNAMAVCIFILFSSHTTYAWWQIHQTELSGLSEALDQLPEDSSVLGLDFVKFSDYVPGRPFLQLSAYASAWRGASTNFSFAEHGSGVVRYRERPMNDWSGNLEWEAHGVLRRDFDAFEYALVNLYEEQHSEFAISAPVEPMTREGRWRLYRINRDPATS